MEAQVGRYVPRCFIQVLFIHSPNPVTLAKYLITYLSMAIDAISGTFRSFDAVESTTAGAGN